MGKKIIKEEENLSMNIIAKGSSLENVDAGQDISIPRILLMQPGSDAVVLGDASMGNYYNKMTQEQEEELKVVLMYLFKQRVLFENDELACKSDDSITASQGLHAGERCDKCELSKWKKDPKTGKSIAPPCRLVNNFFAYTKEDLKKIKTGQFIFPKVISFAKTAYQCSKDIISTALFLGKDLFCFGFTLKSVKRTKDKYTYFVPTMENYEDVPVDLVQKLAKISPGLRQLVGRIEIEMKDVSDPTDNNESTPTPTNKNFI